MRRALLLLMSATFLLPGQAIAADADVVVSDVRIEPNLTRIDARLTASSLPAGTGLDPASVKATMDGRALPVTAAVVKGKSTSSAPSVLVVVDTSGSMQGQPMIEAKQAVSAFVANSPDAVKIGLLRFSSTPELLVPPTTDRTKLLGAISALQAQGETALYDGVLAGLRELRSAANGRLVVLSDGGDTRSAASMEDMLKGAASSGVNVDAIGFNTDETVGNVLARLAASGQGKVHSASSSADLSSALATTVREHARALNVSVLVPEDLRGEHDLVLEVSTPKSRLTAREPISLGSVSAPAVESSGWWGSRNASVAGIAGIAASLLLGSLVLLAGGRRDQRKVQNVLNRYTTAGPAAQAEDLRTASPVVRTALEFAGKVAVRRDLQDKLVLRLDRAGIAMTPAEWLLLRSGVAFGTMLLLVLLGKHLLLAALLGALVATAVPALVLRFRGGRRQKAFEERLPDALQMVAGSLSAGYSLAQSLDGLVREGSQPMATEMGRALAESRLGVPIETTLDGVAARMGSRDFSWVVMAIRVQREVGGNLAGVLTTVSATMRERAMLRRHVRGLSAEGRLSAYILIGLPVFLALYMLTLRQEYIRPLYTTPLGIAMIVVALLLLLIGSFWMSRMVKVEV